jgi:Secretion system C-terminal sorting domain
MKRLFAVALLLIGMTAFGQENTEITYGKTDETNEWDLRCYPNPTSDLLIVRSSKEIKSVDFFDLNGREIKPTELPNNCFLLSDLPSGWIFLLIESTDGYVEKKNVYKQ